MPSELRNAILPVLEEPISANNTVSRPFQVRKPQEWLVHHVVRSQLLQSSVQGDEDRDLSKGWEETGQWVDLVFSIHLLQLLCTSIGIIFILFLNFFNFRLDDRHGFGAFDLLLVEGVGERFNKSSEEHNRQTNRLGDARSLEIVGEEDNRARDEVHEFAEWPVSLLSRRICSISEGGNHVRRERVELGKRIVSGLGSSVDRILALGDHARRLLHLVHALDAYRPSGCLESFSRDQLHRPSPLKGVQLPRNPERGGSRPDSGLAERHAGQSHRREG
mmetsp:Transcript_10481/g.20801  ORF Transcript_10481/g.20801 Transcript_10481/m.20801 type:complete len:276 (-) Transcript_10481:134-961(-)